VSVCVHVCVYVCVHACMCVRACCVDAHVHVRMCLWHVVNLCQKRGVLTIVHYIISRTECFSYKNGMAHTYLLNTESELQSAAFRMSLVVTPAAAAANDEAPQTEWAPKTPTSTSACCRVSLSHLAMDDNKTGLCGFITATNSFTAPSRHSGKVTVKYFLREAIKHSSLL